MSDRSPGSADRRKARSGSEKRKRTATVIFRATAVEKAALEADAQRAGVTPSDYARAKVLGGLPLRAARRPQVETEALARALGLLGKYGSNVNQLAHEAHLFSRPPPDAAWSEIRAQLREMRAALMLALGKRDG